MASLLIKDSINNRCNIIESDFVESCANFHLKCIPDSKMYPHRSLINTRVICSVEKNRNGRLANPNINYNVHCTFE